MIARQLLGARPHVLAAALCTGLAAANLMRPSPVTLTLTLVAAGAAALALRGTWRVAALVLALAAAGWLWGSVRLDGLDRSVLATRIGHVDRTLAEVIAPVRHGQFGLRAFVRVRRFGAFRIDEPALLELPLGRAPPQGAVIETVAEVRAPRPPKDGFDETAWLKRQGMHVVLHGRPWRQVGRRGGLAGLSDQLHEFVARGIAPGLRGERAAVIAGVVLGADEGLSKPLQDSFRRSGCITSWPSRARTSRSSRERSCFSPPSPASPAGWGSSRCSRRSEATCSPSGCSPRWCARESRAPSPPWRGSPPAPGIAGTSS